MRRVEGAGAASGPPFPMKRKYRFFFLANTTGARVLPSFLRPGNPMAKLSKKSCHPEASAAAVERAPRVAPRLEAVDQRLRRFRFFSCFRVGPKPLDRFLAKTARRGRPEMAPQRLEKIKSAPGNGSSSEAWKPQHLVPGARLTVRSGGEPQERCRIRRAGTPRGNFPPRKALKSLETEKESRKPRRRDE